MTDIAQSKVRMTLSRAATLALTLLVLGVAMGSVVASLSLISAEADASSGEAAPVTTVAAMTVELEQQYSVIRRFTGQIEAAARADLGFELGGRVTEVLVEEGDVVPAGAVLARLDTSALIPERAALEAELAAIMADAELARLTLALGGTAPTVWETNPARRTGALGYNVIDPAADDRRDYHAIYDASGDAGLIDDLIMRLAKGGEIVLAGFYSERVSFAFPAAFMREAHFRVAAEWQPGDLAETRALIECGRLGLEGLITNRRPAGEATEAYPQAFTDPDCLKMVLDWSEC